jgi:hypothetical protein
MELPLSCKLVERDGDDYKWLKGAMARRCAANDRRSIVELTEETRAAARKRLDNRSTL